MMAATVLTSSPFAVRTQIKARSRRCVVVSAQAPINPDIKKESDKVVDTVSTTTIKGKAVYCRCWRSATFPLCNGSHVKWNKETGDNVGPLILEGAK